MKNSLVIDLQYVMLWLMGKQKTENLLLPTGIKVIGGVKELTGEEFGVYVKRILPGGLASSDGK